MKFLNLLKKELSELITKQMIVGLVLIVAILALVGKFTESTIQEVIENMDTTKVNICDKDGTEFTRELIKLAKDYGCEITFIDCKGDDYAAVLDDNKIDSLIVIPAGFTEKLDVMDAKDLPSLHSISRMTTPSALGNIKNDNSSKLSVLQECIKDLRMQKMGLTEDEMVSLKIPAVTEETTVINGKTANISAAAIMSDFTMKNSVIPIIIFVLIVMTAQTIINAVSTERIDKTLETLLSTPVSRTSIIGSKMLAAAIIAMGNAVVYMVCFMKFIGGAADGAMKSEAVAGAVKQTLSTKEALSQLGLNLVTTDYILIGVQVFLTIMIALAVSIILGALVDDAKTAQAVLMPFIIVVMVPYFISMLADVNSLPGVMRIIVYAIPFTHTFAAINNLSFGNDWLFYLGIAYQAFVFVVCMFFALKLYNSDKILTASLNFGQKKKLKKHQHEE